MGFLKVLGWIFVPYIMIFVSWKKLKGAGKAFGIIWASIAGIIFISNLANGGSETPTAVPAVEQTEVDAANDTKEPAEEVKAEPTKEPEKTEFAIGEAVQLKDNVLTVNKIEKSAGTDFDTPKDGMEYVIVTVTIENAGKDNINYNPLDFKMANSQGNITDGAFTIIDSETALSYGELAPGGKVSGTISFEQPKDDPKLQLQYQPSFWSSKTVKVNLQ